METLQPIPTPASVRWREFRIRVIPIATFVVAILGCVWLWQDVGGGGIAGLAEAEPSYINAPQNGEITDLLVTPYQLVTAGQPIAILRPVDPRAAFDQLQAELALGRMQMEPSLAEDNAMSFERIRVELLRTKSELAVARVNLERSDKEVARYTPLFNEKLISEDIYELSLRARDAYKAEVDAKDAAAKEIEQRLTQLSRMGMPENGGTNTAANPLLAHLEILKASALTNLEPITLTAPMDGMVHFIHRRAGESVLAGEPLINISPLQSERIVAYLRQPYPVDLEIGMTVEVRTRERHQRTFHSEVVQIGARLEAITNALAFVRPNTLMDAGLPFVVRLPDDVQLRPGEMVDLMIKNPKPALSLDFKGGSGGGGSESGTALSTLAPK